MEKITVSIEDNMEKMSSLNYTVPKIMAVANDLNSSARDLVKVIQMDPVLTAKVLKLINSAYFMLSAEVTSLSKAIIMLGINTIKNLAISTAVANTFQFSSKCKITSEGFWRYSVGAAVLSGRLARQVSLKKSEADELFVVGLLHVIGKALLVQFYPDDYNRLIDEAEKTGRKLVDLERQVFEMTHQEIGGRLGRKWQLPSPVVDGIEHYTTPLKSKRRTTHFLSAATFLLKEHRGGFSGDFHCHRVPKKIWLRLGFSQEEAEAVMDEELFEELASASSFLVRL